MDPFEQLENAIEEVKTLNGGDLSPSNGYEYAQSIAGDLFEYYRQIVQLGKLCGQPVQTVDPSYAEDLERACNVVLNQIQRMELSFRLRKGATSVAIEHENHLVRLSKEQVEEIEEHINEARQKIRSSDAFEEKHKRRLLNRLENYNLR